MRQCDLLGVNRSSYYYEAARESPYNEHLMRQLDEQYTQTPFYGVLGMTEVLREPKEKRSILNESVVYPG